MTQLNGIPNCATVKKARAWLDAHQVPHLFRDFKKDPLAEAEIRRWLADIPQEMLLNRRGTTWRGLPPEVQARAADEDGAAALMLEYPSLIKRPVLEHGGKTYCGFSEDRYREIFQAA